MGCKWSTVGTTNKVNSMPVSNDPVIAQHTTESFDITLQQPALSVTDHSNNHTEYRRVDQSILVVVENSSDQSTTHGELSLVYDGSNDHNLTSTENSMQDVERMTIIEHLSPPIYPTESDKRPMSAKHRQEQINHHDETLTEPTVFIFGKSIVQNKTDIL